MNIFPNMELLSLKNVTFKNFIYKENNKPFLYNTK